MSGGTPGRLHPIHGRVGFPCLPMFTSVATPTDDLNIYSGVEATTTGPVCGLCTDDGRQVRHASVDHVRACHQIDREREAQYLDELAAGA